MQIPSPERAASGPTVPSTGSDKDAQASTPMAPFSRFRLNTLILIVAAIVQLALLYIIRRYVASPDGGDFCRDAVAMQRILAGQSPYAHVSTCGILFNVPHPPAYFLLIGPFALLPVAWGAALWDVFGLLALSLSLALIVRELRLSVSPALLALLLAALISWPPLLQTLLEAQVSPILLLLMTLAWLWGRQRRSAWAGMALGLAAAVRLFPALAVLYFAIRRDWRATLSAIGVFVGLELLATPMVGGVAGVRDYIISEAPASSAFWITHEHNVSIWGFTHLFFIGPRAVRPLLFAPWLASPLTYAILALLLGFVLWRGWRNRHQTFAADEYTFLAYIPLMLLASPLTWQHYFVMLLLPLVVILAHAGKQWGRTLALFISIEALIWIAYLVDIAVALAPRPLPATYGVFIYALPTYALLLIYMALLTAPVFRRGGE